MNNTLLWFGLFLIAGSLAILGIGIEILVKWDNERHGYVKGKVNWVQIYNTKDQVHEVSLLYNAAWIHQSTSAIDDKTIGHVYYVAPVGSSTIFSTERLNLVTGSFNSTEEWRKANDAAWEEKLRREAKP